MGICKTGKCHPCNILVKYYKESATQTEKESDTHINISNNVMMFKVHTLLSFRLKIDESLKIQCLQKLSMAYCWKFLFIALYTLISTILWHWMLVWILSEMSGVVPSLYDILWGLQMVTEWQKVRNKHWCPDLTLDFSLP